MNKLIDNLKKKNKTLHLIHEVMHEEYIYLLNPHAEIKKLFSIINKKNNLLNKLICIKKEQTCLEKKYNIYSPYIGFRKLNYYSNIIKNMCILLKNMNIKNKEIMQHQFCLNQKFLNLYKSFKNNTIYNIDGT